MGDAIFNQTDGGGSQKSKRGKLILLRAQLYSDRDTFKEHWSELGQNIRPRRTRFITTDVNRGGKRNQKIINTTPTMSSRTLRSGMMGGITSPARPWFKLTTPNPDLALQENVREWLELVSDRMSIVFLHSNLYNTLPIVYGDLGDFSTAAMMMEEDFEQVIRTTSFPLGSYAIAKDFRGKVNVFYREFRMTVRQIVEEFGRDRLTGKIDWSNISSRVKNFYDSNLHEVWIDINHAILPNADFRANSPLSQHKRFASIYFEIGYSIGSDGQSDYQTETLLREKGYDFFPVLCPRWEVTGEDVYGTDCPGMTALGDIKALYLMEKRKAQAIEKMVNPPMKGPSSLRNQKSSILPGDITYIDRDADSFKPVHEVNIRLQELQGSIDKHEDRIKKAYFEDLFLMMTDSDRREITATEIDERKEEKLLALGPVLEQLNQDLLDPLIENTFQLMLRQGRIPAPPQELHRQKLSVQYVSIMAQAQKLIGSQSLQKFAEFAQGVAEWSPSSLDKVNADEILEAYGDQLSIPAKIIRSDDEVKKIRQNKAQLQAKQMQAQQMAQEAQNAKNLSQADTSGDNALTGLMDQAKAGQIAQGA